MFQRDIFDTINTIFNQFDYEVDRRYVRGYAPYVKYKSETRTYDDGEKIETYKNGKLHGEVTYHDSKKPSEYWIEGRQVSKDKWDELIQKQEDERTHCITIDGYDYKIKGKQLKLLKEKLQDVLKLEQIK